MSVIWNKRSNIVKNSSAKLLTLHVVEFHLAELQKLLGIENIKPIRQTKGDLWKNIAVLNLPSFANEENPIELNPVYKISIMSKEDGEHLSELLKIKLTPQTRAVWFPYRPEHKHKNMIWTVTEKISIKYPIYILSKGRSKTRLTMKTLDEMNVFYRVVVEPQEFADYNKYIPKEQLLILPEEYLNKNQGGIPARNYIWQHSMTEGHECHWILDDNIKGFFRWNENIKLPLKSGICFKMIEDYLDLHENVAQCGMQYASFFPEISLKRPVILTNTRIYSCILINMRIKLEDRWRGKYNEDTDLSLRLLKAGYSTLLFQNFLCGKQTTLSVKGGNSEIYSGTGLQDKLDSLINQHPDVVSGTIRFKKVHHMVDYKPYKKNKIILKKDIVIPTYPEMVLM